MKKASFVKVIVFCGEIWAEKVLKTLPRFVMSYSVNKLKYLIIPIMIVTLIMALQFLIQYHSLYRELQKPLQREKKKKRRKVENGNEENGRRRKWATLIEETVISKWDMEIPKYRIDF